MFSYHVYAEYPSYKNPGITNSINTIMHVDQRILTKDDYNALKSEIVSYYDMKIDPFMVVITSLTFLGEIE